MTLFNDTVPTKGLHPDLKIGCGIGESSHLKRLVKSWEARNPDPNSANFVHLYTLHQFSASHAAQNFSGHGLLALKDCLLHHIQICTALRAINSSQDS